MRVVAEVTSRWGSLIITNRRSLFRGHNGLSARVLLTLVVICALGAGASATASAKQPSYFPRCSYVEAGPAGPKGNKLKVNLKDEGGVLYRQNNKIRVLTGGPIVRWRDSTSLMRCHGKQATVNNIDRIVVKTNRGWNAGLVIDQSGRGIELFNGKTILAGKGGPFAPGATREAGNSEIEISFTGQAHGRRNKAPVVFAGSDQDDSIKAELSHGLLQLRFSTNGRGERSDGPDLKPGINASDLLIFGGGGNDTISMVALGNGKASRDLRGFSWGAGGDDRMFGHAGRDHVVGGPGDDLLKGGAGDDGNTGGGSGLEGGSGSDLIFGGSGSDQIIGGIGHDTVYGNSGRDVIQEKDDAPDQIYCGPGVDRTVQFDKALDKLIGCAKSALEH